ncbi:putative enzyme related to lactoylglutathione lyase [Frigoribacterium sp. PvP120]|uniref:VOC family protein n=1 Tax=unclassified Frigoribacterium TaxID=2627005 RepID=UPI001AEB125D|nr:VOC family protein [Frigoribacterium sp. PvP121]
MAKDVVTVWVPVADMKRAVAFYRDTLGLEVKKEEDEWSELDAGGLVIGLNGHENATVSSDGGAVITFQPEGTIEDKLSEIRERGGEIEGSISEHPFGHLLPFKDSEGNDLQFFTPPAN